MCKAAVQIRRLAAVAFIATPTLIPNTYIWAAQPYDFEQLELAVSQTGFERDAAVLRCTRKGCNKPLQIDTIDGQKYFYEVKIIAQSGQLGLVLNSLIGPRLAQDESAPIFVPMGHDGRGKTNAAINLYLAAHDAPGAAKSLVWRAIEPPVARLHIVIVAH